MIGPAEVEIAERTLSRTDVFAAKFDVLAMVKLMDMIGSVAVGELDAAGSDDMTGEEDAIDDEDCPEPAGDVDVIWLEEDMAEELIVELPPGVAVEPPDVELPPDVEPPPVVELPPDVELEPAVLNRPAASSPFKATYGVVGVVPVKLNTDVNLIVALLAVSIRVILMAGAGVVPFTASAGVTVKLQLFAASKVRY